jgi:N-acylneuraminate cytidylyltransferase
VINGQRILAIIPARGGSKGLPRKNIIDVNGKPLIQWTIDVAKDSKYLDRVVISTEDDEIASICKNLGADVPFKRPISLAEDSTPGMAPILHAVDAVGQDYELVMVLQPTSPLRLAEDIDAAIELLVTRQVNSCVSVSIQEKSPYWMYSKSDTDKLVPILEGDFPTRQSAPVTYALNGAIYVALTDWLKQSKTFLSEETIAFVMPRERSIDVDGWLDLILVNALLSTR